GGLPSFEWSGRNQPIFFILHHQTRYSGLQEIRPKARFPGDFEVSQVVMDLGLEVEDGFEFLEPNAEPTAVAGRYNVVRSLHQSDLAIILIERDASVHLSRQSVQ